MKKSIKRTGLLFALLIIIVGVTSFYIKDQSQEDKLLSVAKGEVFPSFSLVNIQSQTVDLDVILEDERLILIYFWSTDCQSCRREMRMISSSYSKYRQNGLEILAINTQEGKDLVREYLNLYPTPFTVVMDSTGELAQELNIKELPTSIMIDSTGTVQDFSVGGQGKMMDKLQGKFIDK